MFAIPSLPPLPAHIPNIAAPAIQENVPATAADREEPAEELSRRVGIKRSFPADEAAMDEGISRARIRVTAVDLRQVTTEYPLVGEPQWATLRFNAIDQQLTALEQKLQEMYLTLCEIRAISYVLIRDSA